MIYFLIILLNLFSSPSVDLAASIRKGESVSLDPDYDGYNLSGVHSLVIGKGQVIEGNGAVIRCDSLFDSDSLSTFILNGGVIRNLTIIGANPEAYTSRIGFYGAVKSWLGGMLYNVTISAGDKWAVNVRGIRYSVADTTYLIKCKISSTKRDGYGYAVWNQYSTVVMDSCNIIDVRHGVDGSSSENRFIITNSTFENAHRSNIHLHIYPNGTTLSGVGMTFKNNAIYGRTINLQLQYPTPPHTSQITGNYFSANKLKVGTIGGDSIYKVKNKSVTFENNYYNGEGLIAPPVLTAVDQIRVGEQWQCTTTATKPRWSNGTTGKTLSMTFNFPSVRVVSCQDEKAWFHSAKTYKTVVAKSDEFCFSVFLKAVGSTVSILRNDTVVKVLKPQELSNWMVYSNKMSGVYKIKIEGVGQVMIDDYYQLPIIETFEQGIKNKVRYFNPPGSKIQTSVMGTYADKFSGEKSLKINVRDPLSSVVVE